MAPGGHLEQSKAKGCNTNLRRGGDFMTACLGVTAGELYISVLARYSWEALF